MRRRVGVGRAGPTYQKKAQEIKTVSYQSAIETVEKLEEKLSAFSKKHKPDIQTDPAFRAMFLQMCAPLGVDPLVSEKKGLWAKLGLGLEEFYSELSVKIAEVCIATRSRNGGIISVKEVNRRLSQRGTKFNLSSFKSTHASDDDIITAVSKLSTLGSGFRTVQIGDVTMIVSVPTELDSDHMELMHIAMGEEESEKNTKNDARCRQVGQVTLQYVMRRTAWDAQRCQRALDLLLSEGMAWIDVHKCVTSYWFPSAWKEGI